MQFKPASDRRVARMAVTICYLMVIAGLLLFVGALLPFASTEAHHLTATQTRDCQLIALIGVAGMLLGIIGVSEIED